MVHEPLLLDGGDLLAEGLVDLGEVGHHGQLVGVLGGGQLPAGHGRPDAQVLLQHVEGQLAVLRPRRRVQRLEVHQVGAVPGRGGKIKRMYGIDGVILNATH